jgi:hypothetical protein
VKQENSWYSKMFGNSLEMVDALEPRMLQLRLNHMLNQLIQSKQGCFRELGMNVNYNKF